jgi:hypothetical protein
MHASKANLSNEVLAQEELYKAVNTLTTHIDTLNTAIQALQSAEVTNAAAIVSAVSSHGGSIYGSLVATPFSLASAVVIAATSVLIIPANPNRKGFTIYNNSTNSLYICIQNPAVAANLIDFCGSNAGPTSVVKWLGPGVYTGAIYGIRNAGVGGICGWEFT